MIDRKKVIKGLKCCLNGPMQCDKCPYKNDDGTTVPICVKTMRNEAVELLMKQEPVKPIEVQKERTIEENEVFTATEVWAEWYCPVCHKKIAERYSPHKSYCKWCGQAVKWDDMEEPLLVLNIIPIFFGRAGNCPSCGRGLDSTINTHYCGECGQAVKWDETN